MCFPDLVSRKCTRNRQKQICSNACVPKRIHCFSLRKNCVCSVSTFWPAQAVLGSALEQPWGTLCISQNFAPAPLVEEERVIKFNLMIWRNKLLFLVECICHLWPKKNKRDVFVILISLLQTISDEGKYTKSEVLQSLTSRKWYQTSSR